MTGEHGCDPGHASIHRLETIPSSAERRARLDAGHVLVLCVPPPPWASLVAQARMLISEAFGPQPALAHRLPDHVFVARTRALQARFAADVQVRASFLASAAGLRLGPRVFRDQLFLRVLPPAASGHRQVPPLHPHRDTWGSRLLAQENWWAPLLPVSRLNTLALYPAWWARSVANESVSWSFEIYREQRREALAAGRPVDYPSAPRALQALVPAQAVPLLLVPGQLACFSGAQMHGSVPNRSGLTRFSFETRTVCLTPRGELPAGPANVDTADRPPYLGWFRDQDGVTLAEALAGPGRDGSSG